MQFTSPSSESSGPTPITSLADPSRQPTAESGASASIATRAFLPRQPITRARKQLSCMPCRQGKLRCNREHPACDQCSKRSRHDACRYLAPPPKNRQSQNMRGRIKNLESLVVNLINQKSQEGDTDSSGIDLRLGYGNSNGIQGHDERVADAASFGQLHISNGGVETSYVGAGHWTSILEEIEDLKDGLDEEEAEDDFHEEVWDDVSARSTVTFGMPRPITKSGLIQEMPSKEEVDRLLPLWFNSADPLLYIIHAPTFQEEYKQFWKDPSSTSVMWIALLYSAMALGIILGPRNPGMNAAYAASYVDKSAKPADGIDELAQAAERYQQLASSAMVLADISKNQPYTLEAMMIYGECEFLRRDDHHSKIFLMNGVALRVAMRMGYHRDPSNFKGISPFQGEMRRRVWHVLNMMDTLIAFAIGLPSMIRGVESDARAPQNLYDYDISVDMTELPKERPITELTPGLYTISKSRVCRIFAEAAELSQKVTPPRISTIMLLDKRLEEAHDMIPEGYRVRPMEESITDPPVLIMGRYNIELLYQKTRVVLHRNFLTAGQRDPRFAVSRKICVDAAIELLHHQHVVFRACQPGAQLQKVWWYMASLSTYDWLLAAMVLCLELNHLRNVEPQSAAEPTGSHDMAYMLGLLEHTHEIWANHPNRFQESTRGAEILKAMLKKCSGPVGRNSTPTTELFQQLSLPGHSSAQPVQDLNELPIPPGLTPRLPDNDLSQQIWDPLPPMNLSSFDAPDIPSEIDWTLWDSTMQDQQILLPNSNNANMDFWMTGMFINEDNVFDFQNPI